MTGKQKLFYLLSRINDRHELTPTEESIKLHSKGDLEDNFSDVELKEIFRKLEDDDGIIRVMRPPIEGARLDYEDDCYFLRKTPEFDKYLVNLKDELTDMSGKSPSEALTYSFDSGRGILRVKGIDIQFNNDGRRIPYLESLTRAKDYTHHSEVSEKLDGIDELVNPKNTYYELCRGIKKRLLEYGITDFLEFDYDRARINPLYKKESK